MAVVLVVVVVVVVVVAVVSSSRRRSRSRSRSSSSSGSGSGTTQLPRLPRNSNFWHFSLRNMLRATTARTFSTSQFPKVVRAWGAFTFWLQNVLRATAAREFWSSLLFNPPEATRHWKNTVFPRLFYLFADFHLLSSDSFSSDSLFFLTALTTAVASVHRSEVWLLSSFG